MSNPPLLPLIAFLGNFVGPDLIVALFLFGWVWMLTDAILREPVEHNNRLIWILVIVLAPVLGAAVYFSWRRPERIRKYGH